MADAPEQEQELDGEELEAQEEELDPELAERRRDALRHIRQFGDPALRAEALDVEHFDDTLSAEAERMGQLMVDAIGVGLAATQVGVLHRMFVYRIDEEDDVTALVNPVIEWSSPERELGMEGCLSLPGVHVEVERAAAVRVRAADLAGEAIEVEAEGLHARVLQHEIDHLDGVLILDRISRAERKEAMRELREAVAADAA